jgi:hypothetical protein
MNKATAASQGGQTGDAGRPKPVAGLASHSGTEHPAVKPLVYGYVRVTEDLADDELQELAHGLEKLADAEGFCIIETRYEYQPGYYGTFYELTDELKRSLVGDMQARICHVVVPSLDHLSSHPLLREQMILRLDEAGVRVWAVEA